MKRLYKGFLTIAQNNSTTNYVQLAYLLGMSIKLTQKEHANISVIVTHEEDVPEGWRWVFDDIIELPEDDAQGDEWKLANEWRAFELSPYKETIKLDADMLFLSDMSHVWECKPKYYTCLFGANVKTFRNSDVTSDYCRRIFTKAELPNVYSAFSYFSDDWRSEKIFKKAKHIYHNWPHYNNNYLFGLEQYPTTDVVFALAVKLCDMHGAESVIDTAGLLEFTHMKSKLQGVPESSDNPWTEEFRYSFTDDFELYIENHQQRGLFHYQEKSFADDLCYKYEQKVKPQ